MEVTSMQSKLTNEWKFSVWLYMYVQELYDME